jgi:hypothetical protein
MSIAGAQMSAADKKPNNAKVTWLPEPCWTTDVQLTKAQGGPAATIDLQNTSAASCAASTAFLG